ncbi:hypothetical protein [Flagellimonas amoyensis]|uniref:hypothetical protein n=1 Tax=Flagellimonas amoyensis TaxID=2169401 RepID=UPI000D3C8B98|nr:hypothetical protein [Allomuricauda amoyensis]
MESGKVQKDPRGGTVVSIFVEGADFKSTKLKETKHVSGLIEHTIEQQKEVLRLNQMNQEELRTIVQL